MEQNPILCPTCKSTRTPLVLPNGDYTHSELYCPICNKSTIMTKPEYDYFYAMKASQMQHQRRRR